MIEKGENKKKLKDSKKKSKLKSRVNLNDALTRIVAS